MTRTSKTGDNGGLDGAARRGPGVLVVTLFQLSFRL